MGVLTALGAWFEPERQPVVKRMAYLLENRIGTKVWIPLPDGREVPAEVLDVITQGHDDRVDTTILFTTQGDDRRTYVCNPYKELELVPKED